MRILVIDFAYQNINQTVMLWKLAWLQAGQAVFFGPGHVSDEKWKNGLAAFIRENGCFDVIICAELVVSALSDELDLDTLLNAVDCTYECPFNITSAIENCERNFNEFVEADAIRIISMLEFDTYNMHQSHLHRLEEVKDVYVVGWGEDFIKSRSQLIDLNEEKFVNKVNDRWFNFVTENRSRIISSPAMVGENEFYWGRLESRRDIWAVQGARYHARQKARQNLRKSGREFTGSMLVNLISVIGRIDPRLLRRPSVRATMNHLWSEGFRTSRYAFTCGSALRFPIRKYFEIPAAGTVLVAQPCNGFAELGFHDGLNAIIAEPDEIMDIDATLSKDIEWAQMLANAGRELVWKRHRVGARAEQYAFALQEISAKRFFGSHWSSGEFIIEANKDAQKIK